MVNCRNIIDIWSKASSRHLTQRIVFPDLWRKPEIVIIGGEFRHNLPANYVSKQDTRSDNESSISMRLLIAALLATASILSPLASSAQSVDVEATIKAVDTKKLSITLDDGKTYKVPEEFNFDGLKSGVKVVVFYTVVDGNRMIDDLQVRQ